MDDLCVDLRWVHSDEGKAEMLAGAFLPKLALGPSVDFDANMAESDRTTINDGYSVITPGEVLLVIKRIRIDATPSLDDITGMCLKECVYIIAPYLARLFTASLWSYYFLTQ